MGRSYVSQSGDLGSIYFNPAGTATAVGVEINASYTPPGAYLTKGYYNFFGVGYKINKNIHISLSKFQFNYGKTQIINAIETPYIENNTLTISIVPLKNFFVGMNANYFIYQSGIGNLSKTFVIDLGLIKKIDFCKNINRENSFSIGTSVNNINFAKVNSRVGNITEIYKLPVIARVGASYSKDYGVSRFLDTSSLFKLTCQSEYQMLLNSVYNSGIKLGLEMTFTNLISLRTGWYTEKVFDFGFPNDNESRISAFTYGLGLNFNLNSLLKIPMKVVFDYTSLPQVSYSRNITNWDNFRTFQMRIIYLTKQKYFTH
ncbi:MAG: hypothetical protein IKD55_00885 [Sediminibacterium sp.]|nr:hypothetical protein [Sediminibacterium sp.]